MKTLAAALLMLSVAAPASATTIVSTVSQQTAGFSIWGPSYTPAFGQTFTLAERWEVSDVTFMINDYGGAIGYDSLIFAWGGDRAVGSALFSGTGATSGLSGFAAETIDTGGVALDAGTYVVVLQATSGSAAAWGVTANGGAYSGGDFVYQENAGDASDLTGSPFDVVAAFDLAFEINGAVAAVPLPATAPLLIAGLGALALRRRRKA